jgi:hypothetical protein
MVERNAALLSTSESLRTVSSAPQVTLRAMNPAQVAALQPNVIGSLRISQVRLLRIPQLEALTHKQARQFTTRQLAVLAPQQREARDGVTASSSPRRVSPIN